MDKRDVVDTNNKENSNRDCPEAVKAILHEKTDYKTKRP
jgi:hypothetical protein